MHWQTQKRTRGFERGSSAATLSGHIERSKNDYMSSNVRSKVLSIRIEPELLDAIKRRARREKRSVSSEIAHLVRSQVESEASPQTTKPISGWLRELEVPDDFDTFRALRTKASVKLLTGVQKKARHKP